MDQVVEAREVVVDRKLGLGRREELDRVVGTCHLEVIDPETRRPAVDPATGVTVIGDFSGFYRLESGCYAHESQVREPNTGEPEILRAREAAAADEFAALRAQMWGGGGRVVYTED